MYEAVLEHEVILLSLTRGTGCAQASGNNGKIGVIYSESLWRNEEYH